MVLFTYLLIYVCIRDKASAATSNTDPTNSKIRLYIIFYTNISGKQLEVGNGEIKRKSASKKVDEARLGKIGVCKRQLHLIMKHTGTTDNFVTFGVLIHGNVKLKYRAWGEFASADDSFKSGKNFPAITSAQEVNGATWLVYWIQVNFFQQLPTS
ncbi:hypothetical protein G6F70_000774 [Rhizopus microsporus]|nr:hypothetical protein G6F71_000525 [Rhizopus microsporus]KAG1204118.1 hypothetical protein G6F70_000774 [Rhizopus microsporus]KAG1215463.1 hypothetical protein G6F69_000981 [Rhizopus microsporus]KAG1238011.1 hypothetical protein G6F67_000751 [Rhizopus microsporus]KAG1269316.1 hypothetical protein G6F68_000393 [Rhizopus microsporus]